MIKKGPMLMSMITATAASDRERHASSVRHRPHPRKHCTRKCCTTMTEVAATALALHLMAMLYVLNAGWDSTAADATALENMNTTGEVQDRRPSPLHASRTELEEERKRTYLLCVSI